MKQLLRTLLLLIVFGGVAYVGFFIWMQTEGDLAKFDPQKIDWKKLADPFGTPEFDVDAVAAKHMTHPKPAAAPNAPAAQPVDPNAAATQPAAPAAPVAAAQPAAAYDLTVQADGLSKAVATLTTDQGAVLKIRFFTNEAPQTVKRITDLIAQGFYNGILIHRVEPGFVVQMGDPTGRGSGGSGVKIPAEFNAHKHVPGIVSMARLPSDINSADSQFFVMLGTTPQLDGQYTIFGKVVEGLPNAAKIRRGDKIQSFTIQ